MSADDTGGQAPDRMEEFTAVVAELTAAVQEFRAAIPALATEFRASITALDTGMAAVTGRERLTRRLGVATVIGLVLDVALTIALATVLSGQADTNRRLRESLAQNYTTSQQQAETRSKVLCPLYTVLLAVGANPAPGPPLPPAAQKARAAAIQALRDGYATLNCRPPLP